MLNFVYRNLLRSGLSPKIAKQAAQGLLSKQKSALLKLTNTNPLTRFLKEGKGLKEGIKIAMEKAKNRPGFQDRLMKALSKPGFRERLAEARKRPSLIEQARRAFKWKNVKQGFKTLGWEYIKQQLWMAKNQGKLFSRTVNMADVFKPVANARQDEGTIIARIVNSKNKSVIDRANLSSSWLLYGTWQAFVGQDNYWEGIVTLTPYYEGKSGKKKPRPSFTIQAFPLTIWCLMKQALGRDGTGAGSVYWNTYLRGLKTGKNIIPYQWSEEVVLPSR